ncbi:hypothetical protein SF06_32410 [Pseudomonas flexibilis]|nr:hypothetical protein SF06_32410 [Pseudomonas flexibilis]
MQSHAPEILFSTEAVPESLLEHDATRKNAGMNKYFALQLIIIFTSI